MNEAPGDRGFFVGGRERRTGKMKGITAERGENAEDEEELEGRERIEAGTERRGIGGNRRGTVLGRLTLRFWATRPLHHFPGSLRQCFQGRRLIAHDGDDAVEAGELE